MSPKDLRDSILKSQVKAIVFDFDGTLYSSSAGIEMQLKPAMVRTAARYTQMSESEARILLQKYRHEFKSSVLGLQRDYQVDPYSFYREVYNSLDLSKMVAYEGLAANLERLSEICHLHILTNSNRSFTERALNILDIKESIFQNIFTVESNNFIRKPNQEVYSQLFQEKLKLHPKNVVFFDDIPSSLKVINQMGAMSVLVGNGLKPEPYFVDLHTSEEYSKKPEFVDFCTHDITSFIKEINNF